MAASKILHLEIRHTPGQVRAIVEEFLARYESGQVKSFGIVYFDKDQQMAFWNWFGVPHNIMAALVRFKNVLNTYLNAGGMG